MGTRILMTGLWGLLVLASPAFAEPSLATAVKTYQQLQTLVSQLQKARKSLSPQSPAPAAAALARAEEQLRVAASHCCRALYTAHLQAAKGALTQHDQQAALHHLRKADETLEKCPETAPATAPQHDQEDSDRTDTLASR